MNQSIKNIILVEDDSAFRCLIYNYLTSFGYSVVECDDGEKLLNQICTEGVAKFHADLIITDFRIPKFNGLQFLRLTFGAKERPPVILMTAFPSHEVSSEASRWGASLVLSKPFVLEKLKQAIDNIQNSMAL